LIAKVARYLVQGPHETHNGRSPYEALRSMLE
jgi:hypothetical protein